MNDQDYIRKAVELADDIWPWDFYKINPECLADIQQLTQRDADALAAQLVRQVDALDGYSVHSVWGYVSVTLGLPNGNPVSSGTGPDRTMNTIRAIVDSGVLE